MSNTRLSGANANYISNNLLNNIQNTQKYSNTQPQQYQSISTKEKPSSGFRTFLLMLAVGGSLTLQAANLYKKPQAQASSGDLTKLSDDVAKLSKELSSILNKIKGLEKSNTASEKALKGEINAISSHIDDYKKATTKVLASLQENLIKLQASINQNAKNENKATQSTIKGILDKINELLNKNQEALISTLNTNREKSTEVILSTQKTLQQNINSNHIAIFETLSQLQDKIAQKDTNGLDENFIQELLELQGSLETLAINTQAEIASLITNSEKSLNDTMLICQEATENAVASAQKTIGDLIGDASSGLSQKIANSQDATIQSITDSTLKTNELIKNGNEVIGANQTATLNKINIIENTLDQTQTTVKDTASEVQEAIRKSALKTQETIDSASKLGKDSGLVFDTTGKTFKIEFDPTFEETLNLFKEKTKTNSFNDVCFEKGKAISKKDKLPYTGIIEDILPDESIVRLEYKKGQLIQSEKFDSNGNEIFTKKYEKETEFDGKKVRIISTVKKFINGENTKTYTDKRTTDINGNGKTSRSFYIINKDNTNKTKTEVVKCMPQRDGFVLFEQNELGKSKVVTKTKDEVTIKNIDGPLPKKDKGILPDGYRLFIIDNGKAIK